MSSLLRIFLPLAGQKPLQQRAARAIPLLLQLALERDKITYGQLARRLGISNPRQVAAVISLAGQVIADFYQGQCPEICSLVVNKASGMPGEGYFRGEAEILSPREKKLRLQACQQAVYDFARWPELLPLAEDFCKYCL